MALSTLEKECDDIVQGIPLSFDYDETYAYLYMNFHRLKVDMIETDVLLKTFSKADITNSF